LIAAQDADDPLLLDTKVFDNKNRDKHYLCKGFNQIYTYTQQYNEPFGYLVIYNIAEQELCFSLECSGHIPMVIHNNKTIFLLTINIGSSTLNRGALKWSPSGFVLGNKRGFSPTFAPSSKPERALAATF
jgi:hypothetical protein